MVNKPIFRQPTIRRDTGVFWDEVLDIYRNGTINLNLYNNQLGFMAGDTISGTIDIEIGQPFESTDLVIELCGVERGHLNTEGVITVKDYHREVKEIISMKQVVVQFPEGQQLQPGQYSYQFQIFTPMWLPESSLFKTKKDRFTVEYTLRAQFTPNNQANYVDHPIVPSKFWNVSLFRGSRRVCIYEQPKEIQPKNYKLQLRTTTGLIKFLGSTETVCEVRFLKNQYYPGEKVDIWLDCDNSKCGKAIRCYKFKLFRQLRCRESETGHYDTFNTCLKTIKEKGCAANKKEQKHVQFEIPLLEKDNSEEARATVARSSVAIIGKDLRTPAPKLHTDEPEDQ